MTQARFSIVGGGIAGLTAAIALQRKGFEAIVYDGAPEMRAIGAGLVLAGNAVKALDEIGISEPVLAAGKRLETIRIRSRAGKILQETRVEHLSRKFKTVSNFAIHRGDLQQTLIDLLQPGTLQTNKYCIDVDNSGDVVRLKFSDGTEVAETYVLACDGVHSRIRRKLLPHSVPRYAGYTCWRGVAENLPFTIDMDETSETWAEEGRFGIAPLTRNRVYWFACVNAPPNDQAMRRLTTDELHNRFRDFHFPIPQLISSTYSPLLWNDIIDIKPINQFAFGKILLMGDAAHATTPNMGQGACLAIEDAAVLVNCLQENNTNEEAFKAFQAKRIKRTTRIVNQSRIIGTVAQLENKFLTATRNFLISLMPDSVMEGQLKFIHNISFT